MRGAVASAMADALAKKNKRSADARSQMELALLTWELQMLAALRHSRGVVAVVVDSHDTVLVDVYLGIYF